MPTVPGVCLRICVLFPAGVVTSGVRGWGLLRGWRCRPRRGAVAVGLHPRGAPADWVRSGLGLVELNKRLVVRFGVGSAASALCTFPTREDGEGRTRSAAASAQISRPFHSSSCPS